MADLYRYGNPDSVASLSESGALPSSYASMTASVVDDVRNSIPGVFRWLVVTDTHHSGMWTPSMAKGYLAMIDVAKKVGADCIAHCGDVITGASGSISDGWKNCLRGIADMMPDCPVPFIVSRGNHDDNSIGDNLGNTNAVISNAWWNGHLEYVGAERVIPADSNGYYWIDFPRKKIRVVQINSSDLTEYERLNTGGQNLLKVSAAQLSWLDSAFTVPDGWKVVCFSHATAYNYNPNSGLTNRSAVYDKLTAHKDSISAYVFGHQHIRSLYTDPSTGIVFVGCENAGGTRTTFTSVTYHTEYASTEARANAPTKDWLFDVCTLMHDGSVERVRWGVQPDVIA